MNKIDVYYSGWGEHWKMGDLAQDGRSFVFEYSPEAQRQQLELSPLNLKLKAGPSGHFPDYQMHLPGLIADSLPDGWGLLLMDKLFRKQGIKIEDVSPLDRLSFLGNRAMGALSFEPSTPQIFEPRDLTIIEMAKEVHKLVTDHASTALPQLALLGGSPQGARPKVLVNYDPKSNEISTEPLQAGVQSRTQTAAQTQSPWFIKFPGANEHPEVCALEFVYSNLARRCGLHVMETDYFDLGKNLSAFGMRRFDREKLLRIPIHTLAGALHADFRIPSSVDYLTFLKFTRFITKDERDVLMAFRQCVFNVAFNNRDDHAKNFSYQLDSTRHWRLAPAYDLTFCTGPGGEHQMDICGEGREPRKSDLLLLAEKSGLNKKACEEVITQTLIVAHSFKNESKNSPIRAATVKRIDRAVMANLNRLSKN